MVFLNDISIREIEPNKSVVLKVCQENNIRIGYAWYKNKILDRTISDEDYLKLIELLKNRTK